ncbi:MAG: hypothetical protein OHK0053_20230 [Microscillaceae bacterium]
MTKETFDSRIPQEGFTGLARHHRSDLLAATFVFALSLPFCLSVAFGAQLPLSSGLMTAIIGGLGIGFLGGAPMAIKMPTIGLIPIIIWGIHHLGSGYSETGLQLWLAVLMLAGAFQFLLGFFRLGNYLSIVPDVVIFGILATMGLDICVRQMHYLIGVVPGEANTLTLIWTFPQNLLYNAHLEAMLISIACLVVLFFSTTIRKRYESILPAPLFVLFVGVLMSWYFRLNIKGGASFFLDISTGSQSWIYWPDFQRLYSWEAFEVATLVALFSSLESMLNIKAVESLDFYRRKTHPNRELMALGLGNLLCGLLGAMPMSSSMIQSASNINSGAKTRWSHAFGALYLLLFLFFGIFFLAYVPWVVLSAILVYWCYGLISPKLVRDIYQIGREQLFVFCFTLLIALVGGILLGLIGGWLCSLLVSMYLGVKPGDLFVAQVKVVVFNEQRTKIMVRSSAVASNYLSIQRQIAKIPAGGQIYLDFSKSKVVDHSFMELVYHHPYNYNTAEGNIEIQGIEDHKAISAHPLATRVLPDKHKKALIEKANPYNERQLDVLAVAAVNNVRLRPNLTYDGNKLQGFSFALGYDIKYRKNKFSKTFAPAEGEKPVKIEFSDLFLSRGLRMSEQSREMSILLVSDLQISVPDFTLNKEGFLAKMLQTIGYSDIDFAHSPSFSEYFLLQGRDEAEIRQFFDHKVISFFEQNRDFSVEFREGKILIHKEMALMNRIELEDALVFAEALLRLIYRETSPETEEDAFALA